MVAHRNHDILADFESFMDDHGGTLEVIYNTMNIEIKALEKEHQDEIEALTDELDEAKDKFESLESELAQALQLNDALQRELNAVQEERDSFESQVSELEQQISESEDNKND